MQRRFGILVLACLSFFGGVQGIEFSSFTEAKSYAEEQGLAFVYLRGHQASEVSVQLFGVLEQESARLSYLSSVDVVFYSDNFPNSRKYTFNQDGSFTWVRKEFLGCRFRCAVS